ncbi:MAG: GAF domain-containing protein [Hyphomicrobiaceae bacterium]|nr:GAF domain-containing protein [Hyphomicrobiaceae bacterium]
MENRVAFVRATEVWVPSSDGSHLSLASGQYGPLTGFADAAERTNFSIGEGLPGRAWELGYPIVFHELKQPLFVREAAAAEAGLTCGVAIPIVKGDETKAVLVLFCGDDATHVGAIEIWHAPEDTPDLALHDGYFGTADRFEFQSRHISFRKGFGLPGQAWENNAPVVMGDLGRTRKFIRSGTAGQAGITRGVGIPLATRAKGTWILAILSALGTPIAGRFEVWNVAGGNRATFVDGLCESGTDLGKAYESVEIGPGDTAIGRALRDGVPTLSDKVDLEAQAVAASCAAAKLSRMVAVPIFEGQQMTSIVVWYN